MPTEKKEGDEARLSLNTLWRQNLEEREWFFGLGVVDGRDIEPYCKKTGDFAVRASDKKGLIELTLIVRSFAALHSIAVRWDGRRRKWTLLPGDKGPFFSTLTELVDHYHSHDLPLGVQAIRLKQACSRPSWLLRRGQLEFAENDLLGTFPPSSSYPPLVAGKGNFCSVYRGKFNQTVEVAIKVCHATQKQSRTPAEQRKADAARETLIQEGHIMSSLRHLNLIRFYGICCDSVPVMIAMELCAGGSLLEHLEKHGEKMEVGERVKIAVEAADGMEDCVHRDLAARNCLISQFGLTKIADFGLSRLVSELTGVCFRGEQIPCRWMAPETLTTSPHFSTKSDVWSFGVLVFEIFGNGQKIYPDWHNKKVATYIRKGQMPAMPAGTPKAVARMVNERCWVVDKERRAAMSEVAAFLHRLQQRYVPPPAKKASLSTNKIKGVRPLSSEEVALLEKEVGGRKANARPALQPTQMTSTGEGTQENENHKPSPVRPPRRKTSRERTLRPAAKQTVQETQAMSNEAERKEAERN